MKKIYLFIICLIFSTALLAQKGSIKGTITDEETGEFLPGVTVQIEGTTQGAISDLNGNFLIKDVDTGLKNLLFSFVGYGTYSTRVSVTAGKVTLVPTVNLRSESIGLEEIEVFADVVDQERQAPTPIATISAQEIEEKMGAQEFPEILKSTPGVFVNTAGGSFGAAQVRIRGFGSENTAVLINGIPVNDMENGRVFWSNWGGLNDVTRNKQVQRGLGVSKLAVSAVGGTINIITKPTDHRKGVRVSYSNANRSWQNRIMLTASTGLMKGDWAVTVSGSTRQGEGFREGTSAESWAYFLSAYKRLGRNHQLVFTAFGAPQTTERGRRATQVAYEVVGDKTWNPAWGFKNGEFLSASRNTFHKPMFILNHYWDLKENMTLSTSAYYSFGRGGGTNINRTGDVEITQPINSFFIVPGDTEEEFQVPWDAMVAENQANFVSLNRVENGALATPLTGNRSKYIIHESRNDHNWVGALSTLNWDPSEDLSITAGLDYRWYRGFHYQTIENLLGGDFWIDEDRFNNTSNNLLEPRNTPKGVGDRIGYDYTGTVVWGGVFLQGEYTWRNLDFFATGTVVRTGFQRNGKFLNEAYLDNSLGKSPWFTFNNFTTKFGVNYRITGRHNVFVNGGFFTRAPFLRNAFVDNRVSNTPIQNLENQEIASLEAGYGYRSARFAANLNVYRTSWQNRAYSQGVLSEAFGGDFVNYNLFGLGAIHQGVELDFIAQATPSLQITGMLSVGDFRWDGNAQAVVVANPEVANILTNPLTGNSTEEDPLTIFTDNKKVGGTAQTVGALGFRYRSPKFWYIGGSANYYDYLYEDFNPEIAAELPLRPDSDDNILQGEDFEQTVSVLNQVKRLPNAFTFDIYGGKSWKLRKGFILQLRANINNITNNQFIIDSEQRTPGLEDIDPVTGQSTISPFVQYYFGRTYFLSVVLNFR